TSHKPVHPPQPLCITNVIAHNVSVSHYSLPRAEWRISARLPYQEFAKQSCLHFEYAAIADRVAEYRVGYQRVQTPLVSFDYSSPSAVGQRHRVRSPNEIRRAQLAVIYHADSDRIGHQRPEFFHQV